MNNSKSFTQLVSEISSLNQEFSNEAKQAINTSLTLRNWCIGGYIHAYELNGLDRANYGDRLMSELAKSLKGIPNCNRRQLYDYLQFYSRYPQIVQTVSALLQSHSFQGLVDMRSKVPTQCRHNLQSKHKHWFQSSPTVCSNFLFLLKMIPNGHFTKWKLFVAIGQCVS